MNRAAMAALLASTFLLSVGCGSDAPGPITSQERDISGVHVVDLQTSGDLTIRIRDTESLSITAPASVIDDLTSDVADGVLVLGTKPNRRVNGTVSYILMVPSLEGIRLEGSGSIAGCGVLTGDGHLASTGSGSVKLSNLTLSSLSANISGSGDVTISGTSEGSVVVLTGSGAYDGSGLRTRHTTVTSTGSGQARVNAADDLDVTLSGSGEVIYSGAPAQVHRVISGSGNITAG
jgi:hypothetical protein